MIAFEVNDMTCGHCVSTITKAVQGVDKDAKLEIDLASHRVQIQPGDSDARTLSDAITEAGYTPVPVVARTGAGQPAPEGGSCCG
ncbi:MAG: heavy-metal-associated domain-containing protein [Burkholderiaceae bacterium]